MASRAKIGDIKWEGGKEWRVGSIDQWGKPVWIATGRTEQGEANKVANQNRQGNEGALRDALHGEGINATPRTAPQAAPPPTITPQRVENAPTIVPAPVNVTHAQPGSLVSAPVVKRAAPVAATNVAAPYISPVERFNAATVAKVDPANAVLANAAQIARGPQAELRTQQLASNQMLTDAAMGRVPSAAELQMNRGLEKAIMAQRSLAAGAQGSGIAAARRSANRNIAALQQDIVGQQAAVRASEQANARGQLVGALAGTRGQDIGLATSQAGMENQINLANAAAGTQVNLANQDASLRKALADAGFAQDASKTNAAASNARDLALGNLTHDANKANQDANLRAGLANLDAETRTNLTEAGLELDAGKANQNTTTTVNLANAAADNDIAKFEASLGQDAAKFNTENVLKVALANAGFGAQADLANLDANTKIGLANLNAQLTMLGLDDNRRSDLLGQAIQLYGLGNQRDIAAMNAAAQRDANNKGFLGSLLGTAGMVTGAILGAPAGPAGVIGGAAAGKAVGGGVGELVSDGDPGT